MRIEEKIEIHKLFWCKNNSKPLLYVANYSPLRRDEKILLTDGRLVSDGAYLHPDLIDPKLFVENLKIDKKSLIFYGDFIKTLSPFDLCWTQAFIGCPIRVSSGKIWAEPFIEDVEKIDSYLKVDEKWLEKFLEFTSALIALSQGFLPVVQPLFRGPIDMAASALSPDRLCIAIYKHPDLLKRFLSFCAEVFIDALRAQLRLLPKFENGYSCIYGIWAPKPICRTQADYSVLISPEIYKKIFLPYDLEIIKTFEYTIFHLHSANIHIAEKLLEIPELKAIQISIDYPAKVFSPPIEKLLPIFKKIQEKKPLIVTGPMTKRESQLIRRELSPHGLALSLHILT
ncbi:TPA: hypothetical protein EYP75_02555 [Candidatus Bathyarchaeota archaeon]|nr:hypothetical protein [Candidatus Bathyarchaeota archaeon]